MKILADTHALLWLVAEEPADRIPSPALDLLLDATNELLVSAITPWELSLKSWRGKLPEARPLLATWDATMARLRAVILPLSDKHGILAGHLDWEHRDPFDRMLAAQAIIEGAVFVSRDAVFDAVPGVRRVWGAGHSASPDADGAGA